MVGIEIGHNYNLKSCEKIRKIKKYRCMWSLWFYDVRWNGWRILLFFLLDHPLIICENWFLYGYKCIVEMWLIICYKIDEIFESFKEVKDSTVLIVLEN